MERNKKEQEDGYYNNLTPYKILYPRHLAAHAVAHQLFIDNLLLVETALGNEQKLAELGLVDGGAAVVQQLTGRGDGGQAR